MTSSTDDTMTRAPGCTGAPGVLAAKRWASRVRVESQRSGLLAGPAPPVASWPAASTAARRWSRFGGAPAAGACMWFSCDRLSGLAWWRAEVEDASSRRSAGPARTGGARRPAGGEVTGDSDEVPTRRCCLAPKPVLHRVARPHAVAFLTSTRAAGLAIAPPSKGLLARRSAGRRAAPPVDGDGADPPALPRRLGRRPSRRSRPAGWPGTSAALLAMPPTTAIAVVSGEAAPWAYVGAVSGPTSSALTRTVGGSCEPPDHCAPVRRASRGLPSPTAPYRGRPLTRLISARDRNQRHSALNPDLVRFKGFNSSTFGDVHFV